MKSRFTCSSLIAVAALTSFSLQAQKKGEVANWLTNTDKTALFAQQTTPLKFAKETNRNPTITVD